MSDTPKSLFEEGGHPTNSKKTVEDTSAFHNNLSAKSVLTVSSEYHPPPFEQGRPDGRPAKVPRIEPRDVNKGLPLLSVYHLPSSSNDSCLDPLVARDTKVENRDANVEGREYNTEARIDPQCINNEKSVRLECREDDNSIKGTKHDRASHMVSKGDIKMENDSLTAGSSCLNWKDTKEQYRGNAYTGASEVLDQWHLSRQNSHVPREIGKSPTQGHVHLEAHEAVGEKKVELKGDDQIKEKDKNRKDENHMGLGDRGKCINDHQNILQISNNSSERRELAKEEQEPVGERDRNDLKKDKEQQKEKENDHIKREILNGIDKEGLHNEREYVEGSVRMTEHEKLALEDRGDREIDGWKAVYRDIEDRKRESDVNVEGNRREKHSGCYEKESDDGCVEGDVGAKREREIFGCGVQQCKRMLRPRGSPQATNRVPHFLSCTRDNDESQGNSKVSTVIYKVGECMQELLKLWKGFKESHDNINSKSFPGGPTLKIRIPAEYVTATNCQVRGGQLWGTDIYTDDSDLVAVLMHTGYCRPTASPPPPAVQELRATIRVLPPQDCYISTSRNIRSRAWGAAVGCSYRVERCCIVKKEGGTIDLQPCLTHTLSVEPTLAPVDVDRTMTTRVAASNALRQQRFVRKITIQYNQCNEPWIKYSISIVADKGLKKTLYTSARLKKGEVLYLETQSNRYELCFHGEKMVSAMTAPRLPETEKEKLQVNHSHDQSGERNLMDRETIPVDVFRWSRCKKPLPQKTMRSIGIPLPPEYVEVVEEDLDWEDVQWSQTGVWIAGKEYALARVHFLSPN